jgi:pimeloyl-ACP methyl ester carboxylesterase
MKQLKNLTWKGSREKPIVLDAHWNDEFETHSVVIFGHGYKGFKDWGAWDLVAEEFSKAGYLFIKFNFSFNGGTVKEPIDFPDIEAFGNNNYSTEIADFKRVIDFVYQSNTLPREKLNLDDLTIMGHSRGGGMAVLTAHQDTRVKQLITLASISDLERRQKTGQELEDWKSSGVRHIKNGRTLQEMPHYYQFYQDYIENKQNLDIQKAASELNIPFLIVHGADDSVVPFSEAEELNKACSRSVLVNIKETNHVFGAKHPWESSELPEKLSEVVTRVFGFLEN